MTLTGEQLLADGEKLSSWEDFVKSENWDEFLKG